GRVGQNEVNAVGPGAGYERPPPGVEDVPPGVVVEHGAVEDLQAERARVQPPDASAEVSAGAPGGFDRALDVDALVEVERAVRAPAEGFQRVVRVLGAEAGLEEAALVGRAGALGVAQVPERVALADVDAAVAGGQPGRHRQAAGKDLRGAGLP